MLKLEFGHDNAGEQHNCTSTRKGDWIIFTCPKCPKYQRELNWRTGDMRVKGSSAEVRHAGNYFPTEYKEAFQDVN